MFYYKLQQVDNALKAKFMLYLPLQHFHPTTTKEPVSFSWILTPLLTSAHIDDVLSRPWAYMLYHIPDYTVSVIIQHIHFRLLKE